jgi:hypothetical protein
MFMLTFILNAKYFTKYGSPFAFSQSKFYIRIQCKQCLEITGHCSNELFTLFCKRLFPTIMADYIYCNRFVHS